MSENNLMKLRRHLTHIQNIAEHIKKKHLKKLVVTSEVVETSDDKKWIYDGKHHIWIDVTMPEGLKDARPIE